MVYWQLRNTDQHFMSMAYLLVGGSNECLGSKLCYYHIDEDWVQNMIQKMDLNGDGGISAEEFVDMNLR